MNVTETVQERIKYDQANAQLVYRGLTALIDSGLIHALKESTEKEIATILAGLQYAEPTSYGMIVLREHMTIHAFVGELSKTWLELRKLSTEN